MDFILYYVLRRFFISLNVADGRILLRKGIIFRRCFDIPISALTMVSSKQTLLLRLLRGRKLTLHTLSGKVSFYLKKGERLPLPQRHYKGSVQAGFGCTALAALCSTKMLAGTILFSTTIARTGRIFGSGYYDGIIAAIKQTAGGLSDILSRLKITVPRFTAILAVFAAAAWIFAFFLNLLRFSRFRMKLCKGSVLVTHGVITLYQQWTVSDNLGAAEIRETASALIFGAAPVYCFGTMLAPPLKKEKRNIVLKALLGTEISAGKRVKPTAKSAMGHIGAPMWWSIANAAALTAYRITGSDPALLTLLWGGLGLSLWYCLLYLMYMRRCIFMRGKSGMLLSARRGTTLCTLVIPRIPQRFCVAANPFQRLSGLCDISVFCRGRTHLRLKSVSYVKVSELL